MFSPRLRALNFSLTSRQLFMGHSNFTTASLELEFSICAVRRKASVSFKSALCISIDLLCYGHSHRDYYFIRFLTCHRPDFIIKGKGELCCMHSGIHL